MSGSVPQLTAPAFNQKTNPGPNRWPWLFALLVVAVASFGSYYRHGINFRDESGTLTLLGQRLLNGEVPFLDVELGYNVGWFAAIAGLFKLTGVDFVATRIFCFALSTLAAVLGFLTVEKTALFARRERLAMPLAFFAGLMLIAVPGMTFKNFNPLAAVANTWCLLGFVLAKSTRETYWRALVGGIVLGATWLVRIDLGTLFTVLWLGTLVAMLIGRDLRIAAAGVSLLIVAVCVAALHVPLAYDAKTRGYEKQLVESYTGGMMRLVGRFTQLIGIKPKASGTSTATAQKAAAKPTSPAPKAAPDPANSSATASPPVAGVVEPTPTATPPVPGTADVSPAVPPPVPEIAKPTPANPTIAQPGSETAKQGAWSDKALRRASWSDVTSAKADKRDEAIGLLILTYLPIFTLVPLILFATIEWLRGIRRRETRTPLVALVLIGGSLTLFAQFFFWRPDSAHLSEFGPGYWTAILAVLALTGVGSNWRVPSRWFAVLLAINAGVWLWRMLPDRWCGTFAARLGRKTLFEGENGVRVYENESTAKWMTEALQLVRENSKPDDYLVAYPYHPSFNVFTNRRTYERNVYIDNAEGGPKWSTSAIERIEKHKPRLIIVGDWDINGTEDSRFKNWAAPVLAHIREKYELKATYDPKKEKFEVYVRKE